MTDATRTRLAAAVAGVTLVFQTLTGYSGLGARVGIERTIGIVASGVVLAIVLVVWSTTVDVKPVARMCLGITATVAVTIVTIGLLWMTYALHSILIVQTRHGNLTTTTFRAALTKSEATVDFYSVPTGPIALVSIDTYDRDTTNAVRVEHTSDTDFTFHAFQYDQRITVTHRSSAPMRLIVDTDGPVTYTSPAVVRSKLTIAVVWGGSTCLAVSLFILWRSRWHQRKSVPKRNMRTVAES
jgi:hypothetical protein